MRSKKSREKRANIITCLGRAGFGLTLAVFALTAPVRAATYTVTNTNDDGPGSLRAAVAAANASPEDDLVTFNISSCPNSVCTIVLKAGELTVYAASSAGKLTVSNLSGPASLIVSGNNASRIFNVPIGGELELKGLTLRNGLENLGGAIYSEGILSISNCIIRNNTTDSSWYMASGGGIYSYFGKLSIDSSEITGNRAESGSGIFSVGGPLTIADSTISENNCVAYGAGIYVSTVNSRAVISNSTISRNICGAMYSSGGGVSVGPSNLWEPNHNNPLHLINVTITQNYARWGGGIASHSVPMGYKDASATFRNSILAENTAGQAAHAQNDEILLIYNLGNNIIGGAAVLGPLANNGGATRTHRLLPGSPAINAGNNCVQVANGCGDGNPALATDQRGQARVGTVDIGAYEFAASRAVPFDYDGDGRTDVSVFRPANGTWYLNGSQAGPHGAVWGVAADLIGPGDYDGDGRVDIAVFRPSNGRWYILRSSDSSFSSVTLGEDGDIPSTGDFGGDGISDVAVFRPSDGTFSYVGHTSSTFSFGQHGSPVVGDYDGDGISDLALFRAEDGVWLIRRSTTGDVIGYQFGLSTDRVVPADYDGDGTTDVAVYRPSEGRWYIANSGSPTHSTVQFGTSGDIPVPGDYDGDGRADIAIFRPSDGTWWIDRSTAGLVVVQWGQNGDKPTPSAFGN